MVDALTPTLYNSTFFHSNLLLFDTSHRYSWVRRVVKRNKTQFLYLVFRQCPRDDNETCRPVDIGGPDIAGHSQKTSTHTCTA